MEFPASDFFMGIVFGICLPLVDIVSDGYLFYSTMNFKGNSLAMAGCRTCYGIGVEESYKSNFAQSECDVCVSDELLSNSGGLQCGAYPPTLDKMTELFKDKSCLT